MAAHATSSFEVSIGEFTGPLELLLDLIERRHVSINDISLAAVTEDFVTYLETHANIRSLGTVSQFLVVAATLLLIKARTLLPTANLTDEEEADARELESRLKSYALYREQARTLAARWARPYLYGMKRAPHRTYGFTPAPDITTYGLHAALAEVVQTLPKPKVLEEERVHTVISIEEMMDRVSERISHMTASSFSHLTKEAPRDEVLVSFLALLELVRRGTLVVDQTHAFADMAISKTS